MNPGKFLKTETLENAFPAILGHETQALEERIKLQLYCENHVTQTMICYVWRQCKDLESFCPWMFYSICWWINIYFLGHFFKGGYIPSLVVVSFGFHFPWQKRSDAGQSFSQFRADSHIQIQRLLFPSFLRTLIIHSCIAVQYGGQQIILFVLSRHHSKICSKRQSQA